MLFWGQGTGTALKSDGKNKADQATPFEMEQYIFANTQDRTRDEWDGDPWRILQIIWRVPRMTEPRLGLS